MRRRRFLQNLAASAAGISYLQAALRPAGVPLEESSVAPITEDAGSEAELDGFRLGPCIHSGAMGRIFRVTGPDRGFAMIMKVPRVGPGENSEGLISFETRR